MSVPAPQFPPPLPQAETSLVDLLDRVLAGGVVLHGELVLSIADVPLVRIDLRALIAPATVGGTADPLPLLVPTEAGPPAVGGGRP
ncbi:MAG TPA: gas vesicle protein [Yinghuangia sp.]|uniref:gas vesicle protein n=1 Tax=Yinghuangia sp. YIM S10712 TaxID=3436930 RepID=UPI002BBBA673|nr:gas vesicle protein [Yinghuangia sp.]